MQSTIKRRIEKLEAANPEKIQLLECPPDVTLEEAYRIYHGNLRLLKSMPRPSPRVSSEPKMTLEEATRIFNENMKTIRV